LRQPSITRFQLSYFLNYVKNQTIETDQTKRNITNENTAPALLLLFQNNYDKKFDFLDGPFELLALKSQQ